jgi:hypothetical protein
MRETEAEFVMADAPRADETAPVPTWAVLALLALVVGIVCAAWIANVWVAVQVARRLGWL